MTLKAYQSILLQVPLNSSQNFSLICNLASHSSDIRQENLLKTMTRGISHYLQIKTAIFWITLIQIIIYFTMLFYGGADIESNKFLSIKSGVLYSFGEYFPYYIQRGHQYYRLITCCFLFSNLPQMVFFSGAQLFLGTFLERKCGPLKLLLLFFLSGVLGNVSGSFFKSSGTVGSVSCAFGLLGAHIGILFEGWKNFVTPQIARFQALSVGLITIFMLLIALITSYHTNNAAILMALIYGVLAAYSVGGLVPIEDGTRKACPLIFLIIFGVVSLTLFVFVIDQGLI